MSYGLRLLIAVDQLANVMLFNGWPDETLSARAWRLREQTGWDWMRRMLDGLFFWQVDHCYACYIWELDRRDLPHGYTSPPKE